MGVFQLEGMRLTSGAEKSVNMKRHGAGVKSLRERFHGEAQIAAEAVSKGKASASLVNGSPAFRDLVQKKCERLKV